MISALAALLVAGQPAQSADPAFPGGSEWIVATIAHSEWCPAGNVRLDVRNGRYALTARASRRVCGRSGLERPVVAGRLRSGRLEAIRAAYARAVAEGLERRGCRDGGKDPDHIVISNGGPQILVIATGAAQEAAPDDLSCWSEAAIELHGLLDDAFPAASSAP